MEVIPLKLPGTFIINPKFIEDERGYFFEVFRLSTLSKQLGSLAFIQENQSFSKKNVIRGLHFQVGKHAQSKLIRVIQGRVLDVFVDLRPGNTYGCHEVVELSGQNGKQVFIPKGFAHGFSVLSDEAILSYKVDAYYCSEADRGILYSDPDLNIDWQVPKGLEVVSVKDQKLPFLRSIEGCLGY